MMVRSKTGKASAKAALREHAKAWDRSGWEASASRLLKLVWGLRSKRGWCLSLAVLAFALHACSAGKPPPLPAQTELAAAPQPELERNLAGPWSLSPEGVIVAFSEADQSLAVIDAATNLVTGTVKLNIPGGRVAVDPDGRTAWIFSNQPSETDIRFVALANPEIQSAKRLAGQPYAVAFSPDGKRAFVVLRESSSVSFMETTSRNEYGRVSLGRQTEDMTLRRRPRDIAFVPRPGGDMLYVAGTGSGAVWAVEAASGRVLDEIETGGGPMLLLPGHADGRVYALVETLNQVIAIDTDTQKITSRIDLAGTPTGAAIGPDDTLYVVADEGQVMVIDAATRAVIGQIPVGLSPKGIALSPDGGRAYVANSGDSTLSVIDLATRRMIATIEVGQGPVAVAFAAPPTGPEESLADGAAQTPASPQALTPAAPASGQSADRIPPNTTKEVFVPEANLPEAMAFAPDGRLFYGELRTGKVRIVENGRLLPDPFYDFTVAGEAETGLLGLAIDPNFHENRYVYVFYTEAGGPEPHDGSTNGPNQVVRLTDVVNKGVDLTPILPDLPSGPFHDGGNLRFGPDGKLYITLGETGLMANSQDLRSPAGKILRVNPDGTIPEDNPFAGQPDAYGAIWAYGFRNPFDLDFHPMTHAIITGENGPGDNDELNLVEKGGNYGWPPSGFQDNSKLVDPIAVINPPIAPVGVTFYSGDKIPEWQNDLFFCSFHHGQLRRAHLAPISTDRIVLEEVVTTGCSLGIAMGPDGALYFSNVNAIYRIRNVNAPALPAVTSTESPDETPAPALPPGARAEDRDVNVNLTEWKVQPSRTVIPAGKVRFVVENLGTSVHALEMTGNVLDVRTEDLGPGRSRQIEVDLAPGTYRLFCPIGNHAAMGMAETLTVLGP